MGKRSGTPQIWKKLWISVALLILALCMIVPSSAWLFRQTIAAYAPVTSHESLYIGAGHIAIDVENDVLTISAERKSDEKESKPNYVKRERFYGSFSRSFDVSGVNVDGIEASYTDGMLNLTLPKKAAEIPASRRLEIK